MSIPKLVIHTCLLFAKDEDYLYIHNRENPLELSNKDALRENDEIVIVFDLYHKEITYTLNKQ